MRRRGKYRGGDGGSLWISFSDLISALMLIFVLVLFYAVYQYYDMLEVKTAELLCQSGLLDEKSSQLSLSQQELEEKENALALAQQTLDDKEAQLNSQSLKLTETELVRALANSNINGASVDDSGAIVFSTEMMFDVNRSTLKDVGKAFLNSFIPAYLDVLMSDNYSQYVSQIIIEGHTDTDGTFLTNMRLSQDRAYAVLRYILSGEFTGISDAAKERLQQIVTVNGRSYSDPIYNDDGTVNMDASRRVVIKFRMNDEDMVNEMLSILDGRLIPLDWIWKGRASAGSACPRER